MTVGIQVTEVPAAILDAVERDARKRNLSVNGIVVSILAQRYGVDYEASYPYTDTAGSAEWVVRMPEELRARIRTHARSLVSGSQRGVILLALAKHYGLEAESPRRRREPAIPEGIVEAARTRNRAGESIRSLAREYGVHRETLTRAVRA